MYYFGFAGRGELIRLIAAAGGLEIDEKAELEDKSPFGSPGTLPCLEHGDLKMAQSSAIEAYIASIAPVYKDLTPAQIAVDTMFACIKEDMLDGYAGLLFEKDAAKKKTIPDDMAKLADKWFPLIENKIPADGFIHGLDFPTMGDLALLNIAKAFMPFGALNKQGEYDVEYKWPKFTHHAGRTGHYPAVAAYLKKSTSMDGNPFGLPQDKPHASAH